MKKGSFSLAGICIIYSLASLYSVLYQLLEESGYVMLLCHYIYMH